MTALTTDQFVENKNNRPLLALTLILAACGIFVSALALFHQIKLENGLQEGRSFCNINQAFNCDLVVSSSWSELIPGVKNSILGMIFFMIVFFVASSRQRGSLSAKGHAFLLFIMADLAMTLSIVLFLISQFIIKSFCLICIASYIISFALFGVSLIIFINEKGAKGGLIDGIKFLYSNIFSILIMIGAAFSMPIVFKHYLQAQSGYSEKELAIKKMARRWQLAQPREDLLKMPLVPTITVGPAEAPVKIVKFSDFECPACQNLNRSLEKIMEKFADKIYLVFVNFPLDSECNPALSSKMHPSACTLAKISLCLTEEDRSLSTKQILNTLYEIKLEGNDISSNLNQVLSKLNSTKLSQNKLEKCLLAEATVDKLRQEIAFGLYLQLAATPTLYINGKLLESNDPDFIEDVIRRVVNE